MALYRYVKAPPQKPVASTVKRSISSALMLIGTFLLVWVSYPIVSFEITSRIKYADIVSGVPQQFDRTDIEAVTNPISTVREEPPLQTIAQFAQSIANVLPQRGNAQNVMGTSTAESVDYTHANNWFPSKPQTDTNVSGRIYFLTIPKLRIKDAVVKIAGDDLNKALIHYGGTGLPGEYGTSVIFGHSILPQFYDPGNYKTIFSLLPKLDEGDEIFVKYDGITYRYVVQTMRVTDPDDITVLEQRFDSAYVRLITCVPPGTYWKRLAVTARLQPV